MHPRVAWAQEGDGLGEALAALEAREYHRALRLASDIHEHTPTHATAALIGRVELNLGQYLAAARHLQESLVQAPRKLPGRDMLVRLDALGDARKHLAQVQVSTSAPLAKLVVDGELVAEGDGLFRDVYLEPGFHELELRADGYASQRQSLRLEAGEEKHWAVQLRLGEEATRGLELSGGQQATLITGGSLMLAALGAAVTFQFLSDKEFDRLDRAREADANGGSCGTASNACSEAIKRHFNAGTEFVQYSQMAYLGAGVAGLLSTGVFLLQSGAQNKDDPELQSLVFHPVVSAQGSQLFWKGQF